jgi:hypothetical protein
MFSAAESTLLLPISPQDDLRWPAGGIGTDHGGLCPTGGREWDLW